MSTISGYYAPDETPEFRDPEEPADWHDAPEEKMLAGLRRADLSSWVPEDEEDQADKDQVFWLLRDLEAYFKQAIADRNAPWPCDDVDADFMDPFAEDA